MLAFSKFWYCGHRHAESAVLCPGKDKVAGCSGFEHEFGSGDLPLRGQLVLTGLVEGFLDAPGGGASDALVDRERIP